MRARALEIDVSTRVEGGASPKTDATSTSSAVVGLVAVGAIHLAQVVPTMSGAPWLGAAFVVLTLCAVVLAAWLLVTDRPSVWLGVATLSVLAIVGYVFTRSVSSFLDHDDVGNWSESLGLVALLVEAMLIFVSVRRILALRNSGTPTSATGLLCDDHHINANDGQ